ncbi:MAG TPA: hypothetical protein VGW40_10730 [Allosphingosinicella sp.]|nr:hypothetical protein [Allosphingosinicella sp.]
MRTGRLSISRGHQLAGAPDGPAPPQLTLVPTPPAPEPFSPDYAAVHDRLTSLERLTRLFELGALSAEEFAAEKALILALPADELVLREAAPVHFVPAAPQRIRARGPSLVGRMLNWKFLLFSLAAGLGFSLAAQPNETQRFLDQLLQLAGV